MQPTNINFSITDGQNPQATLEQYLASQSQLARLQALQNLSNFIKKEGQLRGYGLQMNNQQSQSQEQESVGYLNQQLFQQSMRGKPNQDMPSYNLIHQRQNSEVVSNQNSYYNLLSQQLRHEQIQQLQMQAQAFESYQQQIQYQQQLASQPLLRIDQTYIDVLQNGPAQVTKPTMDLTLGVQMTGSKQRDFFKFLCGKNLSEINLSTPQRQSIYDYINKVEDESLIIISPFNNPATQNMNKPTKNTERSSCFRGVSKNGHLWQVLIMNNKKKKYVGSFADEKDAALLYDKVAILTHGIKAKTNFGYTKLQLIEILKENINID